MKAVDRLIRRVRAAKEVVEEELPSIIQDYSDIIIDMVANEQLYEQGINGYGESIASYEPYSVNTIRIKLNRGQPADRVTLRDTGSFHQSFRLKTDDEGFYISPTDKKTLSLTDRYGSGILRLTNENVAELIRGYVRPELLKRIKHYL